MKGMTSLPVKDTVLYGLKMLLVNVGELDTEEVFEWEIAIERWYIKYYHTQNCLGQHRRLQRRRDSRDISTNIEFVTQQVAYDDDGMPMNEIAYNQRISFTESQDSINFDGSPDEESMGSRGEVASHEYVGVNPVEIDNLTAEEITVLPFRDDKANECLTDRLREKIDAFKNMRIPLEVPFIPEQSIPTLESSGSRYNGLSAGVLTVLLGAMCYF